MNFDEVAGKVESIDDELARLRRERPRTVADDLADALVDTIESILSADAGLSVPEAVEVYMAALNAHIDRRVSVYMRGAGEIAP